jgi:hypothetical protein
MSSHDYYGTGQQQGGGGYNQYNQGPPPQQQGYDAYNNPSSYPPQQQPYGQDPHYNQGHSPYPQDQVSAEITLLSSLP